MGYLPTWAIYFTVYDKVKESMGVLRGELLISTSAFFLLFFSSTISLPLAVVVESLSWVWIVESEAGWIAARMEQMELGRDDKNILRPLTNLLSLFLSLWHSRVEVGGKG